MEKPAFIIRPFQPADIKAAMNLSTDAGWNQTEKDWKFLTTDARNICLIAESDKNVIGSTTAINYSNKVAWIGMVLVDKQFRGNGVSKILLANVLEKLGTPISVKLDATPEGQPVYKKLGFKDEYLIARMTNTSLRSLAQDDDYIISEPVQAKHIPEIVTLDKNIFGADRSQLIRFLVNEYPAKSWLLKRNSNITGFALGRDGFKYHHIGPVVASTTADAVILVSKAMKELANQSIVIDVLYDKEDLITWLYSVGFIKQRHFIRMYRKENPLPGITGNLYLIAGPEFG